MRKSLLKPLTAAEIKLTGGRKITNIGQARREKVVSLLATAYGAGKESTDDLESSLKREFGKKRDWGRVARTELTDAKGRASLSVVQQVFGMNAKVYRQVGASCCDECKALFGKRTSPKIWQANRIPDEYIGAVHPNCTCGPWKASQMPDLTKAADPMADLPMGLIKREYDPAIQHWVALVSTGNGYWTRLDSPTGRSIVQTFAMHVPVIKIRESLGFTVCVHGKVTTKENQLELYDLRKMSGARFYPMDLGTSDDQEMRVKGMTQVRDLNQYLTHLKDVMPHVALMPEYWDNDVSTRWLPDLFGYKTLTDWIVLVPGKIPAMGKIKSINLSLIGQRKAIRATTYEQLEESELKK